MSLAMQTARKRLAALWFAGAGVCFVVLLFISFFSLEADLAGLWDWFLPAVVPNLSLIVGVLVYVHRQKETGALPVDAFLYKLAFGLSLLYLALLLLPLLIFPATGKTLPDLLDISRLWHAALQGLVTAAMGAFFVRQESR